MVENQYKVLVIIWGGFIASLVIYLLLPQFVPLSTRAGDSSSDFMRTGLWTVVLVICAVLWWWNQRYLTKEALISQAPLGRQSLSNYVIKKIVAFALAESIAIYGLILALLGYSTSDQVIMSLISGGFLIYHYPSRSFFDELIRGS